MSAADAKAGQRKPDGPMGWLAVVHDRTRRPKGAGFAMLTALALRMNWQRLVGYTTERQLAADSDTSLPTVRPALDWAQRKGLLDRLQRGHRITDRHAAPSRWQLLIPLQETQPLTNDHLVPPVSSLMEEKPQSGKPRMVRKGRGRVQLPSFDEDDFARRAALIPAWWSDGLRRTAWLALKAHPGTDTRDVLRVTADRDFTGRELIEHPRGFIRPTKFHQKITEVTAVRERREAGDQAYQQRQARAALLRKAWLRCDPYDPWHDDVLAGIELGWCANELPGRRPGTWAGNGGSVRPGWGL